MVLAIVPGELCERDRSESILNFLNVPRWIKAKKWLRTTNLVESDPVRKNPLLFVALLPQKAGASNDNFLRH